jgi:plastocyanin
MQRMTRQTALVALGALGAALMLSPAAYAVKLTPEEQAEICREAAVRYKELYGKEMAQESVQVIAMYKYTFCPVKLQVKQGAKVRFINLDKRTTHSYWFRDAGRDESERYFGGEGSEMVMDLPVGSHTYLCGPHYESEGMIGAIEIVP